MIRTLGVRAVIAVALLAVSGSLRAQNNGHWVATWATALVGRPQTPPPPASPAPPPFMRNECPAPAPPPVPPVTPAPGQTFAPQPFTHIANQTLRQIVHTSLGGKRMRVVLSNALGSAALTIGAAHVALRSAGDEIKPSTGGALTFSGRTTVTIPAFAVAYSDPVAIDASPLADVAVDVYLPGTTNAPSAISVHVGALQTNYISETGNYAGAPKFQTVATMRNWYLLSRVEVDAPEAAGVIVAFGDSITDGSASTPDRNARWPDVLAQRLQSASLKLAVVNAGIGGNRVLGENAFGAGINALARFDTDVLGQTGITHAVVLEGINDIGQARRNPTPTAADLIAAHTQLVERAHARGVKMIGATLTPFWGAAAYTDVGEAKRQALNEWIRNGRIYDGVIDFDKATRDPSDPKKFLPAYDSCDHLHPGDAGYKAMADAVDLKLFRAGS